MCPLLLCNSDPIYYCLWWDMRCAVCILAVREICLLKSPRMIKAESKCCCSVSVIRSASFCKAELTCACGGTDVELLQRIERLAVNEERF